MLNVARQRPTGRVLQMTYDDMIVTVAGSLAYQNSKHENHGYNVFACSVSHGMTGECDECEECEERNGCNIGISPVPWPLPLALLGGWALSRHLWFDG